MLLDYSPIVLDSIKQDNFPKVDLYVKHGNDFTLYKPAETKLTSNNIERLRENGTEFVYINSANSEEVQTYIEKCFDDIQSEKALSQFSKNLICSQIIINCINDVFDHPDIATAFHKCRIILKQFSLKFENRDDLLKLFTKLECHFSKYLVTHSAQVTILSMFLHEKLFNNERSELIDVGAGAMLHDIGMLYIASDIIEKTDALSESEYYRVKIHPKHGSDLLNRAGMREQVPLEITLYHHERYDGSGYPKGLNGQQIPRHAALVSICDIFCALTMNKPYRRASSPEEALEILKSESKLFHPTIFNGFIENMTNVSVPDVVTEEEVVPKAAVKTGDNAVVKELRRKIRVSSNDRNKLLQLHSLLTDNIQNSYGEERVALIELRSELKNLLNSLFSADKSLT